MSNPFASLFSKRPSGTIATLARLAPGGRSDEISLTLATFDPATCAPYECISYDRSRDLKTAEVSVDGKPTPIPLPLKEALHSFRHGRDSVLLWADLLTGSSAEERSQQAQVMKTVMQNAQKVTCWLGNGNERSSEAFDVLQTLANWSRQANIQINFPKKLSQATMRNMTDLQEFLRSRDLSKLKRQDAGLWQEINGAISSPYFKSGHAITDLILGKDVVIRSGSGSIRWEDLNMAVRAMLFVLPGSDGVPSPLIGEAFQLLASIDVSVQRAKKGESLELLPMIQSARDAAIPSDPRELVFSILPIVTSSERVKILRNTTEPLPVANYTKTTEQVFTEAAKYIIQERQDFLIWWNQIPPCQRKTRDLPSFVPDWSTPLPKSLNFSNPNNGLRQWSESIKAPKRIFVDDDNSLHVQAHAFDQIVYVSPAFTLENYRGLLLKVWQEAIIVPGEPKEKALEKYWRCVVMDSSAEIGESLRDKKKPDAGMWVNFQSVLCEEMVLQDLGCTMEELKNSPELQARARDTPSIAELGPSTGQSAPIEELIIRNSLGRRMFRTASGKVGMTAVEAADDYPERQIPNLDGAMSDMLGRSMLSAFQAHLAQRNPEMARALEQASQGRLLGQRAPGVRSGDLVVALVGGFQPYVLRPESATGDLQADAKYAFVGDCHLQGAMEGECLVDPNDLYGGWKQVPLVDVLIV
jgi:hypothetical protein